MPLSEEDKIKIQIDNYIQNIEAIVALSELFHPYGSKSVIGKKLFIKEKDGAFITPDLVTEFGGGQKSFGVLTESKSSLPDDQDRWLEAAKQLKNYDNDLKGWNLNISDHCIIIITQPVLTRKFWAYLKKFTSETGYNFKHKISIFHFTRREKALNHFIVIRKDEGEELLESALSQKLYDGEEIPLQNAFRDIDAIKFYDAKPHPVYVMEVIWDAVISQRITPEQYMEHTTSASIPVDIDIDSILTEMRSRFTHNSNHNVIQREWIKEAFQKFVEVNLAERLDKDGNKFRVHFRKRTGKAKETRNFLLKLVLGHEKVDRTQTVEDVLQTKLFTEENNINSKQPNKT